MTTERIDTARLLEETPISEVIGRRQKLKKVAGELEGLCPFHDEQTASLKVNDAKGIYKCFGCGAGGDAIDYLMRLGATFHDACNEIKTGAALLLAEGKKVTRVAKKGPDWEQILEPQTMPENFHHYKHGEPSKVWTYRNAKGLAVGYVCRFDTPDGKEVLPYTMQTNGKVTEWRWQGFAKPRPLYNLHELTKYPDATVLLVEGEKAADAVQSQLDPARTVVIAWIGGGQAVHHTDWSPLAGRKVIAWPDNDAQGMSAMLNIQHIISHSLKLWKILPIDTTLPKGWDGADKEWAEGECRAFVLDRCRDNIEPNLHETTEGLVPTKAWRMRQPDGGSVYIFGLFDGSDRWHLRKLKPEEAPAPPPDINEFPGGHYPGIDELPDNQLDAAYFRVLGFDKTDGALQRFHFFAKGGNVLISITPSQMTKNNLLQLAPLRWWEDNFSEKNPFNLDAACNWLINEGNKRGPFSDRLLRGRGAWRDAGRTVIHTGNKLIVDGVAMSFGQLETKYIYEAGERLGFNLENPLAKNEANKLMEILELINWERPVNANLLAGWCVVAPVCGALSWRPHIWLTGGAGTGKTWVMTNITRRLLGEAGLAVQGETSEPGIRALLQHDAMPVVFDEAEGEDRQARERMQSVIGLMRAASADDGGIMAKGIQGGGAAKTYRIRSCFAFASIVMQVAQQADRSRVTVLAIQKLRNQEEADAKWVRLQELYLATITDEFVARLQARTISMLPIILENARTFSAAAAAEIGEQRAGDQLGILLAGAYSLYSDGLIQMEAARKWVRDKDWNEERGLEYTRDEVALMSHLMNEIVQVESMDSFKLERTVGELVQIATAKHPDDHISAGDAGDRLKRLGFRVVEDCELIVSNSHNWIIQRLEKTSWSKNHHKILLRIENAREISSARFASGLRTRAVTIPLVRIFEHL